MSPDARPAARRLVVMRHAKAVPTAPSDHERDLAPDGRDAAAAAGRWLVDQGIVPDLALVSDATRTRRTWADLAAAAGWDTDGGPRVEHVEALYAAGPDSALDLVREVPDDVRTLVVVAHNPTVASISHLLHDGLGDEDAALRMAQGHPTGALTVLDVPTTWAEVGWATTRLVDFHVPRG
ncbi:SixA phosphatase family protein [Nocardioides alkalitolerans]|uniref:SixA phosphatase family protein n=1 Tax=Nocardioides alkalitolerans TaxID=281714 RepID=UPI0003F5C647|nr:histidine phosphatase family protein [Nocardioides alkalitolerans]